MGARAKAGGARVSVACQSCFDPLKGKAASAVEHDVGSHQEARPQGKTEVIFIFDGGGVATQVERGEGERLTAERAAAQYAWDCAGLTVKRIVAFQAQHPVGTYLRHGAQVDASPQAGSLEGIRRVQSGRPRKICEKGAMCPETVNNP